jgi:hypothetical protein
MTVRVVRLMEYTYPDIEAADRDMRHWQIPANGARDQGNLTIRSSIILDAFPDKTEEIEWQITRKTGPSGVIVKNPS